MPVTTPRLALNLFWRTFALLALLLAAGVLAWQQTFKALEAEPKALEAAQQHVLRTGTHDDGHVARGELSRGPQLDVVPTGGQREREFHRRFRVIGGEVADGVLHQVTFRFAVGLLVDPRGGGGGIVTGAALPGFRARGSCPLGFGCAARNCGNWGSMTPPAARSLAAFCRAIAGASLGYFCACCVTCAAQASWRNW